MAAAKAPPKRYSPRMLEVLRIEDPTSKTRRVTFSPSTMNGLDQSCAAAHIKLFFPREGQEIPVLPELGPRGPIWPPPDQKPIVRTYSIVEVNAERAEVSVEFVLHDAYGPAGAWAEQAQPGQKIGMAGPGPALKVFDTGDRPLLLFGDLSARPAIQAILGAISPERRGQAVIFIPDEAQRLSFPHPPGLCVQWSLRQPSSQPSFLASGELQAIVQPYDQGPTPYLWAAGEHSSVVEIRDHLRVRWNLGPGDFYAVPYWRHQQNEEQYHDLRHKVVDELRS